MDDKKKNYVISNPDHYKLNGLDVEVRDVIKSALGTVGFLDFYKGNIIKYILRANKKNGLEDYKKARQYLDWYIQELDEDADCDGQLSYLEDIIVKEQPKDTPEIGIKLLNKMPPAVAINAEKILLEDKMKQELTPEETHELDTLSMKMLHTAVNMTKEEMERYKELVTKKFGTEEEIKEEQRQNRENFYKLQEKLSKKVTK